MRLFVVRNRRPLAPRDRLVYIHRYVTIAETEAAAIARVQSDMHEEPGRGTWTAEDVTVDPTFELHIVGSDATPEERKAAGRRD